MTGISKLPTISIVIPTYNCAALLSATFKAIEQQHYPQSLLEKIIVDGGSTDPTRVVAKRHNWQVVDNPVRSNLYGLPLGFAAATGELILHIDDDNVLDRPDWLTRMVEPFTDPTIIAAEPMFYSATHKDSLISRYIALIGADDPVVMYLGFHDRFSYITNSWTGVPHADEDRDTYVAATFLDTKKIPSLACNAFMVRRHVLLAATKTPWLHIDGAVRMLEKPGRRWAKVRVGIINYHAPGVRGFFVKKIRRLHTRAHEAAYFEYQYPLTRADLVRLLLRSFLFVPLVWDAVRGFYRKPDSIWVLHPLLTLGTILTYLWGVLLLGIRGRVVLPVTLRAAPKAL